MLAAIDAIPSADAVADHAATAMGAARGEGVNGALEAIEGVGLSVHEDDDRSVVIVAAGFTSGHRVPPR